MKDWMKWFTLAAFITICLGGIIKIGMNEEPEVITETVIRSVPTTLIVYETKVVTETVHGTKLGTKWYEDESKIKKLNTRIGELEYELSLMQSSYGQAESNYQCLIETLNVRIEELDAALQVQEASDESDD